MPRGKSFKDQHFLRVLPNVEDEAITDREVAERVGCSRVKANMWLREKIAAGLIEYGKPGRMGAYTYYLKSARPETSVPRILDNTGKYWNFDRLVKGLIAQSKEAPEELKATRFPVIPFSVVYLYLNAINEEEYGTKFTVANQEIRGELMRERETLKRMIASIDSILTDPFLSGDDEEVIMAQDAMVGLQDTITVEDLETVRNMLR